MGHVPPMLSLVRGHYTVFVYDIMQWWVWGAIHVTENSRKLTFSCFIKSCYHPWILQNLWAINHLISSVQYSSCFYFFKIYFYHFWIIRVYECLCVHISAVCPWSLKEAIKFSTHGIIGCGSPLLGTELGCLREQYPVLTAESLI